MARMGNNVIPNAHFHKHWQRRIKTWFDQAARKYRRRQNRLAKAAKVAPRPVSGPLRPIVRCPSIRYNAKVRFGRGFTLEELKGAGLSKYTAKSIGIAVDYRRTNKSVEALQKNIHRLKQYRSKLILFPKKVNKPAKDDSSPMTIKLAQQLRGPILPIKKTGRSEKVAKVTKDLTSFDVYRHLRRVRADKRMKGKREKRAKDAADDGIGKAR